MGFTFVPASEVQRKASLIIGLSGLSGSGKTYSALLLAQILAKSKGGPVYGIDTENGRMADYKDAKVFPQLNPFKIAAFDAPYSSDRYGEVVLQADKEGAGCIVIDSGSDEWVGIGGVLDLHEVTVQRMMKGDESRREKMNFPGWAIAKPPHKKFADTIFRLKAHLIICFRAQPKTAMVGGKVVDKGLQPICGTDIPYVLRFHLLMADGGDGLYEVLKAYAHERGIFPTGEKVNAATGTRLLGSLDPAPDPKAEAKQEPKAETKQETKAEPKQEPKAESQGETVGQKQLLWRLNEVNRYECAGLPSSQDAQRSLYVRLRQDFSARDWTQVEARIAREIATVNTDLIENFPEEGRKIIQGLVAKIPAQELF